LRRIFYIIIIFLICVQSNFLLAQEQTIQTVSDTTRIAMGAIKDSLSLDTIPKNIPEFSIQKDSIPESSTTQPKISEEAPDEPVNYGAKDTTWFDNRKSDIHLYGDAYVEYENYILKAGYIIFDFDNNIAHAMSITDDAGHEIQPPTFNDGTKEVIYEELRFNFKTKKGIVYNAISQEGNIYLHGAKTKFVSAEGNDELEDDVVYNSDALVTTCNHENPHWGIRTSKLKIIPDKIAVIGPANLELGGVPTPIFIPFGFFPLAKGASTGFMFPSQYGVDDRLGIGFRDIGWYFPVNEYFDITATADWYSRGTWGVNLKSNYKKRYKYTGSINLEFNDLKSESTETGETLSNKSIGVKFIHRQDPKAHPYMNLSGDVNFETRNNSRNNYNDVGSVQTNIYFSNLKFRHDLPGTPFKLNIGLSHNQNTNTNVIKFTLPDIDLSMPRPLSPFKRKNRGGNAEKWYERINVGFRSKMRNYVEATDSTLFTKETLDDFITGMESKANAAVSFKAFKYLSINPSVNYTETWYLQDIRNAYNELEETFDEEINRGFQRFYTYNANVSATTQLFGTMLLPKGKIKGIRTTIKPTFGLGFTPNTRERYEQLAFSPDGQDSLAYSPFPRQPFTSSLNGPSMRFTYGFRNNIEIKYFSSKDSTEKKFRPLETINVAGDYNFQADSLNWSRVRVSSSTNLFKGMTNLTYRFTFDPYEETSTNRSFNQTVLDSRGKLLRMEEGLIGVRNTFSIARIKSLFSSGNKSGGDRGSSGKTDASERGLLENPGTDKLTPDNFDLSGVGDDLKAPKKEPEIQKPSFFALFEKMSFTHDWNYTFKEDGGIDTSFTSIHSIGVRGSFPLTDNWDVSVNNLSYDFVRGGLNYPSFTFTRKLHCWYMNFAWQPNRGSYNFFIGVSSNEFNFLKYNYGDNNFGAGRFGL